MKQNDGRADLTCITLNALNGASLWIVESSTPCMTSGSSPGGDTSAGAGGFVDWGNTPTLVQLGVCFSGATAQAKEGDVLSGSMGGGGGERVGCSLSGRAR
jgi:hypothetical protein